MGREYKQQTTRPYQDQIPFLQNNENKRGWNATNYYIGILIPFHSDFCGRCCGLMLLLLSFISVSQLAEIILTQIHSSIKAELAVKMECNLWILTWTFPKRPRNSHLLRINFALPLRLNQCFGASPHITDSSNEIHKYCITLHHFIYSSDICDYEENPLDHNNIENIWTILKRTNLRILKLPNLHWLTATSQTLCREIIDFLLHIYW